MIKQNKKTQFELVSSYKTAPNIGIIKYWGKWHEQEIIPLNDNIGITLCQEDIYTLTTIKLTPKIDRDTLIINGKEEVITNRINKILAIFYKKLYLMADIKINQFKNTLPDDQQSNELNKIIDINTLKVKIKSINSFPTASGLASSSSGLSALALCLVEFIGIEQLDVRYLSRIGSGSSCRCLYGNFVLWPGVEYKHLNNTSNQEIIDYQSKRCLAQEIKTSYWLGECLNVMIFVDQFSGKKEVSSSEGMQRTWQTSQLIQDRVEKYVPQHIEMMMNAFEQKDFNSIMQTISSDSNQFHATCLDTYPPLFYLNQFSQQIINMVHSFNQFTNFKLGYTFDAGSHAVILIHNDCLEIFIKFLSLIYDLKNIQLNNKFVEKLNQVSQIKLSQTLYDLSKNTTNLYPPNQIILTKVGSGPQRVIP